jgi:multidrug efflux pump subunit AcrB
MMKNLNLTEIVLRNRQTLVYFMVSILVAGVLSYTSLGRMEDPDFVIRQMVISVAWPGADTGAMQNLVLDKMERQLQQTRGLKTLTSRAEQGRGTIYITLAETFPADQVRAAWKEVRNLTGDIKGQLPLGVVGPFFNDGFDDIFGSIYALTGDDFSPEDKRREAENIRRRFLRIDDVSRVELIGVQEEKIYLEIDPVRLAALGISPMDVRAAVSGLEGMLSAGMIETESDNVFVRVSGMYGNLDDIGNIPLEAGGRVFRISDVAAIEKRYAEPQAPIMLFNGKEAIGIAVSMERGANNIRLGEDLAVAAAELRVLLPLGLELFQAADQPQVVQDSIREFMRSIL